jgi:integrase
MESVLYDAARHRRSPATMPGYHQGRPPMNKGLRYPADPPTVEEIVAVMRAAGDRANGARLRALIVILWRAGLRIGEALPLAETDLDQARGAVLVRNGKGGRRREVGMDPWAWQQLKPWLDIRATLPVGSLLWVIHGPTAGRQWEQSAARKQLRRASAAVGYADLRFAPTAYPELSRLQVDELHVVTVGEGRHITRISNTRISGSRRSTCKASTARRSSTRSTGGQRQ